MNETARETARTWGLRLLAVGIAIGIWFNASLQDRLASSERLVEASVSYNRPRGFIIINPVPTLNVRLAGSKKGVVEESIELIERFHLADVMSERTAILPYGKQRLLEIALAFACSPRVLLLDEPAAGVPEAERHEILATIAALPKDVTVLLIEHDMDLVFSFADRISVLVNGALLTEGAPEAIARDPRVRAVYLGEAIDA